MLLISRDVSYSNHLC